MNGLKGKSVHFNDNHLIVELEDNRIILTPLDWYPELKQATIEQLKNYRFICRKTGIEWIELDYQLSIESMLIRETIKPHIAAA